MATVGTFLFAIMSALALGTSGLLGNECQGDFMWDKTDKYEVGRKFAFKNTIMDHTIVFGIEEYIF
jgi:hypothetical protein